MAMGRGIRIDTDRTALGNRADCGYRQLNMNVEIEQLASRLQAALDATLSKLSEVGGQLQHLAQDTGGRLRQTHRHRIPESPIYEDARETLAKVAERIQERRGLAALILAVIIGVLVGGVLFSQSRRRY